MPAFIRFVSGMCSDVLLKVGELGKLSLADLASIGFNTKMNSRVLGEIGAVGERFPTARAFIGFRFAQMDLGVKL